MAVSQKDVHIIMIACPGYGHTRPLKAIAKPLINMGYPITFIGAPQFEKMIESAGAEFYPLQGSAGFNQDDIEIVFPERKKIAPGPELALHDFEHVFLNPLGDQHKSIMDILNRDGLKNKKVVIISDAIITGTFPILLDAPGRRVPIINVGSFPLMMMSRDTTPFGVGLPSQGVEANTAMNEGVKQVFAPLTGILERNLKPFNCKKPLLSDFALDNFYLLPDRFLQLCVPQLEYPRSDLPSNLRYIGTVTGSNDKKPQPEWFQSFVVNDTSRPLVFVTSGSLPTMQSSELIEPTLKACADLPVRVVVCTVAAKLPADFEVPDNARIAEWISFEELFPHTDLIVSNGGYGTLGQAFSAGVPMVVGGVTEDKMECCARAAMTGAAIDLRTQTPSVEQVRDAVVKVLISREYKRKAVELQEEYKKYDTVAKVVETIEELTGGSTIKSTVEVVKNGVLEMKKVPAVVVTETPLGSDNADVTVYSVKNGAISSVSTLAKA
ncbi:MAG: hypothetical protein M1820_003994 [Bogoriella megaspora]|nr:MAG: hypothetical protein M1820_003994 [Bogoriella megaspora]